MARRYNYRTGKLEDNGVPVVQPAPGTTYAKDASPLEGLTSGNGTVSTAGRALADAPAVFQPQAHAASVLAPTLTSQGVQPAAGGPAVAQALRANRGDTSTAIGKVGPAISGRLPSDPLTNLAGTTARPNGGFVTVGGDVNPNGPVEGGTGIYENGVSVPNVNGTFQGAPGTRESLLKDAATSRDVTATAGLSTAKPPASFADQKAAILEAYPQVGVAGSDQNKQFVDAFTKGGSNQTNALDLAHSLFAPKTQTETIAADQTAANKKNADALAARTPTQVARDTTKAQANQAKLDAVGKQVEAENSLPKRIAQSLSDESILDPANNPIVRGAQAVGGAVKDFFGGFGGGNSPATPAPTDNTPPVYPMATSQATPAAPANPLTNLAPAPVTPPVPSLVPPVPNPADPEELRKKRLAASSVPTFMQ